MPETPKEKPLRDPVVPNELEKEDSWETDQEKRGYYYDDAHGYETYVPDGEETDSSDLTKKAGPSKTARRK